jgi:hypothetical protein
MRAIKAGPSPTALTPEARAFIEEDFQYKVKACFTEIVLADELLRNLTSNLKISKLAVIPL